MKSGRVLAAVTGFCLFAGAAPVNAAGPAPERPELLSQLVECKAIAESAKRLACYDARVDAIDAAERKQDLVVLDRKQVRETRKSLFGFSLPKLPFLSGGEEQDAKDDAAIESTILAARDIGYGKWWMKLADGAEWVTTEAITFGSPRVGKKIEIKRAAMGSFLGKPEGGRAVRMKRVG